jgi:hypothetical protein
MEWLHPRRGIREEAMLSLALVPNEILSRCWFAGRCNRDDSCKLGSGYSLWKIKVKRKQVVIRSKNSKLL